MRLFNASVIFIFFVALCLVACKRDFLDPMGKQVEFTQKEIEIKWAEARSGRWYTYSHFKTSEQSKKERINLLAYESALFSFSENAKEYYRGVFNEYFRDSIDQDVDVYLDSIYPIIYPEMDKRMVDSRYMEQLFIEYTQIKIPSSYRRANRQKLMAYEIDETWVTRCQLPSGFFRVDEMIKNTLLMTDPLQKPWTFRCAGEAKTALDRWYSDFHRTNNGHFCEEYETHMFILEDNFFTCLFNNRGRDNPTGEFPDPIPPGGTTGGNNNSSTPKGFNLSNLSEQDKKKFEESIDSLKKRCGFKKIIELVNSNGSIPIKIDPNNNSGGGVYRADLKQINISDSEILPFQGVIIHEIFHAYQHQQVYLNNFSNYKKGQPGNINIEFEQIVFQDIVNHISRTKYGYDNNYLDDIGGRRFTQEEKTGYKDAFNAYEAWINTLTNNGTSYPDLSSRSNFNAEFIAHLNNFQKYGEPGYTNNSTILPNLNPEALKKYFNNTLNCNN